MNGRSSQGGKERSRRSFLKKFGVGLIAFVPTARALATSKDGAAQFTLANSSTTNIIDIKLAELAIHDDIVKVVSRLGQPQNKDIVHGHGGRQYSYAGIIVNFDDVDETNARVRQIIVASATAGSTSSGVKVGTREADVRRIHGDARKNPDGTNLILDLAPGQSLVFTFTSGFVSAISLQEDACPTCSVPQFPPREHP